MLETSAVYQQHGDMTKSRVVRVGVKKPVEEYPENLIKNSYLYNVVYGTRNLEARFAFPACPIFLIRQPRGEDRCAGYANRQKLEYFVEGDLIIQIVKQPNSDLTLLNGQN